MGLRSPHHTSWPCRSRSCASSEPVAPGAQYEDSHDFRKLYHSRVRATRGSAFGDRACELHRLRRQGRTLRGVNSDPVDLRERHPTVAGRGAGPLINVAEGLGGNARASRLRQQCRRAWKGANQPKICGFSAMARFHARIGFLFFGVIGPRDDSSRQIRTADCGPADFDHRPVQLPLRLLPFGRPGKLPRA